MHALNGGAKESGSTTWRPRHRASRDRNEHRHSSDPALTPRSDRQGGRPWRIRVRDPGSTTSERRRGGSRHRRSSGTVRVRTGDGEIAGGGWDREARKKCEGAAEWGRKEVRHPRERAAMDRTPILGGGGMSTVYCAAQDVPDRAAKILRKLATREEAEAGKRIFRGERKLYPSVKSTLARHWETDSREALKAIGHGNVGRARMYLQGQERTETEVLAEIQHMGRVDEYGGLHRGRVGRTVLCNAWWA